MIIQSFIYLYFTIILPFSTNTAQTVGMYSLRLISFTYCRHETKQIRELRRHM